MAAHDYRLEDDLENFNFKNLNIGEEWEQSRGKRQNKAEMQG